MTFINDDGSITANAAQRQPPADANREAVEVVQADREGYVAGLIKSRMWNGRTRQIRAMPLGLAVCAHLQQQEGQG